MRFATPQEDKEIYAVFKKHEAFFPHIRFDYLQRRIRDHECIYQDGVVINFSTYKKTVCIGTCKIPRNDCMLHQIANGIEGNGKAKEVLNEFQHFIVGVHKRDLWLSVRADNIRATKFYEKNGFVAVGSVKWMKGTMDGLIYRYTNAQTIL